MPLFEGASEFAIHGGQFNQIAGDAIYHLGSHGDSVQMVRRLVEKDLSLNQYSVEHGTVTIPSFPKRLLLQDLQVDPDAGRISAGSCSFDLLARLGLFPGQPNEALAEYDRGVPLDAVISRGNCYCRRISRHGFIFLVSKYFQHASMGETTKGGTCFILSTSIGRFKCYEIDDRIFVHFDSGTRSSYVDLVKDQNLDHILRTSRGEYQATSIVAYDGFDLDNFVFGWCRSTGEPIESIASARFCGVPNAVIYMTKSTLQRWKRLGEFAGALIETVLSVLDGVTGPAEFVTALRSVPHFSNEGPNRLARTTPAEKLASCIFIYRALLGKNIHEWSLKSFHEFTTLNWQDMVEAHKHFRSPLVEGTKLILTSHDRFLKILDGFQTVPVDDFTGASYNHIRRELQTLLHTNKNNVALVALQGYFALLLQWNATRILLRAREAPDEWIRFVGADDDMLFIG